MSADKDWRKLGEIAPTALRDSWVQAHWATQAIAAAADAVLEPRSDDGHTSMAWDEEHRALVGRVSASNRRVALAIEELALLVLDGDSVTRRLALTGHTMAAALAWVAEALQTDRTLRVRSYRLPEHPVGRGGRFTAQPGGELRELARWYATASDVLGELARTGGGITDVATWPHHFDTGGILFLDLEAPPEEAPQIGFGLAPADHISEQPYYYVTAWPLPAEARLPDLPHGARWRRDRFDGAILSAAELIGQRTDRRRVVREFLDAAVAAGRELVRR